MTSFQPRRLISGVVESGGGVSVSALAAGLSIGAGLGLLTLQWHVSLGDVSPARNVWACVLAAGMLLGWYLRTASDLRRGLLRQLSVWGVFSLWIGAAPWILGFLLDSGSSGISQLAVAVAEPTSTLVVLAILLGGGPAVLAGWLAIASTVDSSTSRRTAAIRGSFLLGAGLGLVLGGIGLALVLGPYLAACCCLLPILALGMCRVLTMSARVTSGESMIPLDNGIARIGLADARSERLISFGAWLLVGVSTGGLRSAATLVWPETWELWLGPIAGVLAGAAMATVLAKPLSSKVGRRFPGLLLAAVLTIIPAVFPGIIRVVLAMNVLVPAPGAQMLLRAGMTAAVAATLAFIGTMNGQSPIADRGRDWMIPGRVFAFLLGLGFAQFPGRFGLGPDRALQAAACGWWLLSCHGFWVNCSPRLFAGNLRVWRLLIPVASTGALILLMQVKGSRFESTLAQRVLFSSPMLVAHRQGLDFNLLPQLDEARLDGQSSGDRGVVTAWKYAGAQWQIRVNGIPKGVFSQDPAVFPRHSTDTLQAVLPLILHPRPRQVMLLGMGSGETLDVTLSFPLERVVCSEPETGLQTLLGNLLQQSARDKSWRDPKLELWRDSPSWSLIRHPGSCDVVLSLGDSPALLGDQPRYTREFYRSVAGKLGPDGIFCQRWLGLDFGPEALAVWVNTIRAEFSDVLLVESAPGEYLCCATRATDGLLRNRWARRLELPHVMERLAESGLDWSQVANLPAIDLAGLIQFTRGLHGVVNSATSSVWPLAMPREMWRPAGKVEESHRALADYARPLVALNEDGPAQPELLRRMSEIHNQHDLMARYSNQYWAYRKFLREQVEQRPRSQIQMVTLDQKKKMHPEDSRRLRYFQVLGHAVRTKQSDDIRRLASFERPYDPLISYFVHQECAELYRFSDTANHTEELHHRLHSIWFGAVRDASLRNVIRSIEIVGDNDTPVATPQERFDLLNALLQALKSRWDARVGMPPSSARELVQEADQTLAVIDFACDHLDGLADSAGVSHGNWLKRREVINRTLVRTVETQRAQWLDRALNHASSPAPQLQPQPLAN